MAYVESDVGNRWMQYYENNVNGNTADIGGRETDPGALPVFNSQEVRVEYSKIPPNRSRRD